MSETQPVTSTDVAVIQGGAVATRDYGNFLNAGFENTTAADFKPSWLRILSGNSPEVVRKAVKGASAGDIIDSVTKDLYPSVIFIPAVHEHVFTAWKPRNEGGGDGKGFGGVFQTSDPMVVKAVADCPRFTRGPDGKMLKPRTPDGEFELIETRNLYGVQQIGPEEEGIAIPASISFYSTNLPVIGAWFATLDRLRVPKTGQRKPLFAHSWRLGTSLRTENGNNWHIWTYEFSNNSAANSLTSDTLFQAGVAVWEAWKAGAVDIDYAAGAGASSGDEGGAAKKPTPF